MSLLVNWVALPYIVQRLLSDLVDVSCRSSGCRSENTSQREFLNNTILHTSKLALSLVCSSSLPNSSFSRRVRSLQVISRSLMVSLSSATSLRRLALSSRCRCILCSYSDRALHTCESGEPPSYIRSRCDLLPLQAFFSALFVVLTGRALVRELLSESARIRGVS